MARTRQPLIAGNWKMNGLKAEALALAKGVADGVRRRGGPTARSWFARPRRW